MNMPVMNGMDATKKLREMEKNREIRLDQTNIYIHSAIAENLEWQSVFDGKLSKPLSI